MNGRPRHYATTIQQPCVTLPFPAWLAFIAFGVLLLITACTPTPPPPPAPLVPIQDVVVHDTYSEQVGYSRLVRSSSPGLSIGYVWGDQRTVSPMERRQTEEITLQSGKAFEPFLLLQSGKATTMLITVLLNYEQIEFELDGQVGLLHEIRVEPNGDFEIPIKVELEDGRHDLIVVAFADPYNASTDPFYRLSAAGAQTIGRRAVVIVGGDETPALILPRPLNGNLIPDGVDLGLFASFATARGASPLHPSERQMYVASAAPNTRFNYQLWVSNYEDETETNYAIVTFLNYHQVPVNGSEVVVTHLSPHHEIIIDTSVPLPPDPGVNQLQMVHVYDPYRSVLRDEVKGSIVRYSQRIAIDTKTHRANLSSRPIKKGVAIATPFCISQGYGFS